MARFDTSPPLLHLLPAPPYTPHISCSRHLLYLLTPSLSSTRSLVSACFLFVGGLGRCSVGRVGLVET